MLEKIFYVILCLISLGIIYLTTKFDLSFIGSSGLGPEVFPRAICVILFCLSAWLLYEKIKDDSVDKINKNIKYTIMTFIIFAIYIFLIPRLGYLVSTILFSFVGISILKKDRLILKAVYSLAFPLGLYLLFTYAFQVSLPTGILI